MKTILPLDKMTRQEKLQAMEELWQDLSQSEEPLDSPAWHEKVLKEREQLVREGKDVYISLDQAKKELREGRKK